MQQGIKMVRIQAYQADCLIRAGYGNLVSGSGWGGRSVWTQPISWDGDEPVLGSPVSPREEVVLPVAVYSPDSVTRAE